MCKFLWNSELFTVIVDCFELLNHNNISKLLFCNGCCVCEHSVINKLPNFRLAIKCFPWGRGVIPPHGPIIWSLMVSQVPTRNTI